MPVWRRVSTMAQAQNASSSSLVMFDPAALRRDGRGARFDVHDLGPELGGASGAS